MGVESRPFEIRRGVRQGDPLSPPLFNAALEEAMRDCKSKWATLGLGVPVGHAQGDRLTNLRFADDVLLIAPCLEQLRIMLADLVSET